MSLPSNLRTLALCLPLIAAAAAVSGHNDMGIVGARKFAQAHDCSGVVAFSGVAARPSIKVSNSSSAEEEDKGTLGTKLGFRNLLTDKSVGWSRESGEFTCFCPGLYQFAFSAAGPDARLSLRKKASGASEAASSSASWETIVSTAKGGGSHVVLLEMEVGDLAAVWLTEGELHKESSGGDAFSSFSGYRISKK